MFDRNIARELGQSENLNITFGSAYRYTNFSINIFYISSTIKEFDISDDPNTNNDDTKNNNNNNNNNVNKEHEIRIYRFWSFDPVNQIPNETCYYVKICSIVNYNNPVFVKGPVDRRGLPFLKKKYPRDNTQNYRSANYLVNSE